MQIKPPVEHLNEPVLQFARKDYATLNQTLTVEQALLTTKKLEQDVMVQIDDAIKTAQAAFERVDATHQASLYAAAALDAERKKLENGKSTSFIVLQLQRDLTFASSEEIRALADYNIALAQVAFVEAWLWAQHTRRRFFAAM